MVGGMQIVLKENSRSSDQAKVLLLHIFKGGTEQEVKEDLNRLKFHGCFRLLSPEHKRRLVDIYPFSPKYKAGMPLAEAEKYNDTGKIRSMAR